MHFSNPIFLYLLPLALIPIVIHLISSLMRRRRPFPYVKLLKATRQQQKGWRRVQDFLLSLVRSLLLLLLILSASGPYVSSGPYPRRVVVDVSASMMPYRDEIENLLHSLEGVDVVFLSSFLHRDMPQEFLYPLDTSLLKGYRDSLTLLISDFQRSSIPDTSVFMKYQVKPVKNASAILNVRDFGDSLSIDMRGGDYLEVREGDSTLAILKAYSRLSLSGDYRGFLRFYLMPMDEHPFDNVFYAYRGGVEGISAKVIGRGLERKLLTGLALGIFGDTSSNGNIVLSAGEPEGVRQALSSGKRVIYFGALPEVPHRVERNFSFDGIPLDSVILFDDHRPYLITDRVFFVGIPLKDLVLEPKLMEWFYPLSLQFSGYKRVIYAHAGEKITLPQRVNLLSPDGELLRGRVITLLDTGYYVSLDSSLIICSNVNRSESDTLYYRVGGRPFRRVELFWPFLMLSFFLLLIEILMIRRPR